MMITMMMMMAMLVMPPMRLLATATFATSPEAIVFRYIWQTTPAPLLLDIRWHPTGTRWHPVGTFLAPAGTRPAPAGTRPAPGKSCYWHPLAPGRHPMKIVRGAYVFVYFMTMQYSAPAGTRPAPDEKCAECICFCILHDIAIFRHPLAPGRHPVEVFANNIFTIQDCDGTSYPFSFLYY